MLAATIFTLGIVRDHLYQLALLEQPVHPTLLHPAVRVAAVLLFAVGSVLVVSSMWALGVTGTYLGDYFGILMDAMVTGFPFNVLSDPMYVGSTLNFVAVALWFARPAGLVLSALVWLTYRVALCFEGPFTARIYREAAEKKAAAAKKAAERKAAATPSRAPYATRSQTRKRAL